MPLKTKNEIVPPPPPAVEISRVEGRLEKLGSVLSNVEDSVVVQAQPGPPPLDEGTILAFEDRTPLGVICEIFGPVYEPLYVVRLSKGEEARAALAQVGTAIFFSPEMMTLVDQQACMIKGYVSLPPLPSSISPSFPSLSSSLPSSRTPSWLGTGLFHTPSALGDVAKGCSCLYERQSNQDS